MKITREFKVGLVTLLALGALYWGITFLKGTDLFENKRIFYAIYDQVDELTTARPVNINGFKVGQIDNIYFHPDGSGRLVVAMNLTNDIAIPKNTVARIYSSDLIGSKAVELVLGKSEQYASHGDTLISKIQLSLTEEVNEQVKPIKEKAEKLISSIDTVMILASGFLNEETRNNFKNTFGKLQEVVDRLNSAVKKSEAGLVSSVDDLSKVTTTVEQNRNELDAIFNNLASLSDTLSRIEFGRTFKKLDSTLQHTNAVMAKIDDGNGSMGALVNDRELYENLIELTEQLNLIMLDLKYNPKRYVHFSLFGGSGDYDEEENLEKEAEARAKRKADSL